MSTRGHMSTVTPTPTMTTATIRETNNPNRSCSAGGGPISNAGTVSTGNSNSTAVVIRPTPASADATAAVGSPAWTSSLAWTTPPVAAPPGTTLLAALPASCAVATVPHETGLPVALMVRVVVPVRLERESGQPPQRRQTRPLRAAPGS